MSRLAAAVRQRMVGCGAACVVWTSATAQAQIRTCVTVEAARHDPAPLERLVHTELARHVSHRYSSGECESYLRVELIELDPAMGGGRYLTGRIDSEVPHREPIEDRGVAAAVERLLTVVLHNDPRRLYGPRHEDWFARQRRAFRVRGTTHLTAELVQVGAVVGGQVCTLPGIATSLRREVDMFHLGARLGAASTLGFGVDAVHLSEQLTAQLELAVFSSQAATTAGFLALVMGLEYQRFVGPRRSSDRPGRGSAVNLGFSAGPRAGVELFRHADARFQLFGQLLLPTFMSSDEDWDVVNQWTPTVTLGVALAL